MEQIDRKEIKELTFAFDSCCDMKKVYLQESSYRKFHFKGKLNKWKKCKRKNIEIIGQSIVYKGNADFIRTVHIS